MTSRLVVLISGNGSNLQAILDACASGELDATVVSVISKKAEAFGLIRAKNAGIESAHFPKLETESRQQYDARLADYVSNRNQTTSFLPVGCEFFLLPFFHPSRIASLIYTPPCPEHFLVHTPSNAHLMPINTKK
jgi:hypothetical protein